MIRQILTIITFLSATAIFAQQSPCSSAAFQGRYTNPAYDHPLNAAYLEFSHSMEGDLIVEISLPNGKKSSPRTYKVLCADSATGQPYLEQIYIGGAQYTIGDNPTLKLKNNQIILESEINTPALKGNLNYTFLKNTK